MTGENNGDIFHVGSGLPVMKRGVFLHLCGGNNEKEMEEGEGRKREKEEGV